MEKVYNMRIAFLIIVIFALSFFLNGSGCTKIETPVRSSSDDTGMEDLSILPEKYEILDTEPVRIEAQGGIGIIEWKTEPLFENTFYPETGNPVLFTPPDLSVDTVITINAVDEMNNSAYADISVIDEGLPPEPGDILINEIAWSGTLTSASDEYIELINKTDRVFYLDNWIIENEAGTGTRFLFYGKINPGLLFLISNYDQGSEKTAITSGIDYADLGLAIPNSKPGPFVLKTYDGIVFDTVGDGVEYLYGINSSELRSSMSRYTFSSSTEWDPDSWYTESVSVNLLDETLGTPGAENSNIPYNTGLSEDDAAAIITEYFIDVNEDIIEDWVELYITKSGNIKNFIVTDLDGTSDASITNGYDVYVTEGNYILVIWSISYLYDENLFYIPDVNPTGTNDELVLLCSGVFLDGLCYTSDGNKPDDFEDLVNKYGWIGDPITGKHASKKIDENEDYINDLEAASWNTAAEPTPGEVNY